jgi:hypothetical protein
MDCFTGEIDVYKSFFGSMFSGFLHDVLLM